jgi:hypothetical protein
MKSMVKDPTWRVGPVTALETRKSTTAFADKYLTIQHLVRDIFVLYARGADVSNVYLTLAGISADKLHVHPGRSAGIWQGACPLRKCRVRESTRRGSYER